MVIKAAKVFGVVLTLLFLLAAYNVTRHLIFWGAAETVNFSSGDVSIVGTFVKPDRDGTFPAVVVLLGSGPETRSGPAYRVNAATMLRHGFAVLIFDKRGAGDSSGDVDTATLTDFAADAASAVRYLASRDDIIADQIGLQANSESGWYSAQVAAETDQVAFIINRVGPSLPCVDTVLWEVRNEFLEAGIAESDLEPLLAVTERRWRHYASVGENSQLAQGPERNAINAELERVWRSVPGASEVLSAKIRDHDAAFYRSYAIDVNYDPALYLGQIDIPLLYIYGGRDVNIPTKDCVAYLEKFKPAYAGTIDVRVYPELGHAMATWRGLLHGGYPPDYLALVGEWAQSQISR